MHFALKFSFLYLCAFTVCIYVFYAHRFIQFVGFFTASPCACQDTGCVQHWLSQHADWEFQEVGRDCDGKSSLWQEI